MMSNRQARRNNHTPSREPVITTFDGLGNPKTPNPFRVLRGVEIEIDPTDSQKALLNHQMGIARHAWNFMVGVAKRQDGQRELQRDLVLVGKGERLTSLFTVNRLTTYLYGRDEFHEDYVRRVGVMEFESAECAPHASKKERQGVTRKVTVKLPWSKDVLVIPSRKKHDSRDAEKAEQAKEAALVQEWLLARSNLRDDAAKAARERAEAYTKPVNPRAKPPRKRPADPGPEPEFDPSLSDDANAEARKVWEAAKKKHDEWPALQAEKAEKQAKLEAKRTESMNPYPGRDDLHGHWTTYRLNGVAEGKHWLRTLREVKADKLPENLTPEEEAERRRFFLGDSTSIVQNNLTEAFKRYGQGKGGRPKPKDRVEASGSVQSETPVTVTETTLDLMGESFRRLRRGRLPLGLFVQDKRRPDGYRLCMTTLKRHGERYYIVLTLEWYIERPERPEGVIGIDVNGRTKNRIVAVHEDGRHAGRFPTKEIQDPAAYDAETKRLLRLRDRINRTMKRQRGTVEPTPDGKPIKKGKAVYREPSNRYKASLAWLREVEAKIANRRKDFNHQITHAVATLGAKTVVNQKLRAANMVKNRKMAQQVNHVAYHQIDWFLHYKLQERGGELRHISSFTPTSTVCTCGARIPSTAKEVLTCPACKQTFQRDDLAALNTVRLVGQSVPYGTDPDAKPEASEPDTPTKPRRRVVNLPRKPPLAAE